MSDEMDPVDVGVPIEEAADNLLPDDSSVTFAIDFLERTATDPDGRRLLHAWGGQLYRFNGAFYEVQGDKQIEAAVYRHMKSCRVRKNVGTRDRVVWAAPKNTPYFRPEPKQVQDVVRTLMTETLVDLGSMPGWLGDPGATRPDPSNIVAFRNGLLDVDQYVRDDGLAVLIAPTPDWFSTTCLPFAYEPHLDCPTWKMFLGSSLSDDQQRIELLREWMGLLLTSATRWQKMLWLFGPPGCGKGTIIRTIQRLLGDRNWAAPTLTELAGPFGCETLIGKTSAFITDAHIGPRDVPAVQNRVLPLVGEDRVDICRKNRSTLSDVRLAVRFTIAVNVMPALPDASNAILRRMLVLPFDRSFVGQPDVHLTDRLEQELGGIINWALAGLLNLRDQGGFTEVNAAKPILARFRRQNSPIWAFIKDACTIGKDDSIPCARLYDAYRAWRSQNGQKPTSSAVMGTDLQSVGLPITKRRPGGEGDRTWTYYGIGLSAALTYDGLGKPHLDCDAGAKGGADEDESGDADGLFRARPPSP